MHKFGDKYVRIFLFFLAIFLIGDGLIHFLNIKLVSVKNAWPASSLSYANLLNAIYASFVFLTATLMLFAQTNLNKYQTLIKVSAVWALFHGGVLIYLVLTQDFLTKFDGLPSLYVWIPFYNQVLLFEAFLAFAYTIIVFIWKKNG